MIAKPLIETKARSRKEVWLLPRLIMFDEEQTAREELLLDVDILTARSSYIELDKKQNVLTQANAGHGIKIDNYIKEDGTKDSIISFNLDERIAIVVDELPEEPSEELKNKMFLVPHKPEIDTEDDPPTSNIFDEYIWILKEDEWKWEKVGTWLPYIDPDGLNKNFKDVWDYIHENLDVDTEFDETSKHPIANYVTTEKFNAVDAQLTEQRLSEADGSLIITKGPTGTVASVNIKPDQAVVLDNTNGICLSIATDDKVLTLDSNGLVAHISVDKVTSDLPTNVLEQYNIVGKNNNILGSIPVYKDSTLKSIARDGQQLICTYVLSDGSEKIVSVDMSDFIHESEYADGLQVINGVISIKNDPSSENFLTISSDGIKLSGVQNAIDIEKNERIENVANALEEAKTYTDSQLIWITLEE